MAQTGYLAVGGMHCASCSSRVERVLRAVPGVATAAVSLAINSATVGFDQTGTLTLGATRLH